MIFQHATTIIAGVFLPLIMIHSKLPIPTRTVVSFIAQNFSSFLGIFSGSFAYSEV
jgi:hypothetical protein